MEHSRGLQADNLILAPLVSLNGIQEYYQGFKFRFLRALEQSPLRGIVSANGQWTPWFLRGIQNVENACERKEICHHGLDHLLHVSQNALVLMDMARESLQKRSSRSFRRQEQHTTFSDAEVLLPTLVHDLGYGLKSVLWQEKEAVNHAEKGADVMERFIRRRGLRNLLTEDDEHVRKSLTTLKTHASLYHDTLSGNSKALLAYANECAKREEIPLASLFPLIVMVADKLDYFRAKRVDAIPAPHRYEDNPYYFLADAVDPYTLTDEQDVLHYSVQLKDHYHLPAENGLLPLHFAMWQNQTAQHFSTVWQLTSSFAHLVGKRLCVTHNQSVRPLTSIAAPEWDDRYDAGSSEAEPCHSRLAQEEAA